MSKCLEDLLLDMCGFVVGVIWGIWLHRNNIVFNNVLVNVGEIIDAIKYRSWKWLPAGLNEGQLVYINWLNESLICI
uniref:Uncharacterized protein n=1 Tax=Cajanus cajan TaxID=3821 RepID=A0A151R4N1_CAJCA|nr:hypothetical protein KK1_041207 [Cajanus cajan]